MNQAKSRVVRKAIQQDNRICEAEKIAINLALDAGDQWGYGNVMAWLATEWACVLRDESGIKQEAAIDVVSNRSPYPLPPPDKNWVKP